MKKYLSRLRRKFLACPRRSSLKHCWIARRGFDGERDVTGWASLVMRLGGIIPPRVLHRKTGGVNTGIQGLLWWFPHLVLFFFMATGFLSAEEFIEKKSTHFIVYYTGVPEEFTDTVLEYCERYYDDLNEKLDFTRYDYWTWDKRAKVYIYPDQDSYAKATNQPVWSGGVAAYDKKTIWSYPREAGFFDSLLPHEIGHIIFREVIGGSRRIPLWLEEGVASYMEPAKRFGSEKIILDAIENNTFIPLKDLGLINAESLRGHKDVVLFYAESVNIVNFLIDKFNTRSFNELCRKIKEGKSLDDALSYAYFDIRNTEGLSELWEKNLKDKIKTKIKTIL